jgi:uncharacterized protein YdhG (YjbR/CyaY superfamily)
MAKTDFGSVDEYIAAQPKHVQVVLSDALVAAFKGALTPYRVSKGTLRFPLSEPVPAKLIARIAKFQAREVARRARVKAAARKTGG